MKIFEIVESPDDFQKQAFAGSRKEEIAHLTKIGNQLRYRITALRASFGLVKSPESLARTQTKINQMSSKISDITQKIRELTITGHSFCFTGFRDKEMERTIEILGGKVVSGVSGRLDFLIALDPDEKSVKLDKARSFGTQVLSKARMLQILRGDYLPSVK